MLRGRGKRKTTSNALRINNHTLSIELGVCQLIQAHLLLGILGSAMVGEYDRHRRGCCVGGRDENEVCSIRNSVGGEGGPIRWDRDVVCSTDYLLCGKGFGTFCGSHYGAGADALKGGEGEGEESQLAEVGKGWSHDCYLAEE